MNTEKSRDGLWVGLATTAVLALIISLVGFVVALTRDGGTPAAAGTPAGGTVEFDVVLADLSVTPKSIEVAAGQKVVLHVTNSGAMDHDLKVEGETGTEMLAPGKSADVEVGPFTATTSAWCTVPGHKAAGMVMDIVVTGAAAPDTGHGTAEGTGSDVSAFAKIDATKKPAEDWEARSAVLPAAPAGKVHEITLDATEVVREVAPGTTQMLWTFNNTVPGPTVRGKVGDTFRFTLTNKGTLGHSIDFHASKVAWNDEMRTLKPGESLTYEYVAKHAGAYMYHCGTAPTLHHIGNGMFGAIIIDPPGLSPVAEEFAVVQSEFYLGPEGQPGDLTKMQNEEWDAVVFNGFHNQYVHRPIHVEKDKRYRMWVVNDGPSENSAFHIVGTIFDTVFKEGTLLLEPDARKGGSQVLDLQPAQGGYVEFSFDEDGLYPFVTHKFSNPGKGALGFFAVGDADTTAIGGH